MEASNASTNAGWKEEITWSSMVWVSIRSGRPVGTSPMSGAPVNHSTPSRVPTISAARVGGSALLSLFGQKIATPRVTRAISRASTFTAPIAEGMACIAPTVPPPGEDAPRNGSTCSRTMITPTPEVNPDITEYGV